MKRIAQWALWIGLIGVSVPTLAQSDSPDSQLSKLEQGWADAAKEKNVAPLESLLSDDFTLTNPVGQVVGKEAFVGKIKDGTFKIDSIRYSDMKARAWGDAAVVTGKVNVQGSWDGNDVSGDYAFTDTFVKQAGAWHEVASQVTRSEQ